MVLSERHCESVRFVRIERHVPRVGPVFFFFFVYLVEARVRANTQRTARGACNSKI